MIGDPLPDTDHVARYCKPSSVDEQGMPMALGVAIAAQRFLRANDASAEVVYVSQGRHRLGDHRVAVVGLPREVLRRCHSVQAAGALDVDAVLVPIELHRCV